MILYSKPTYILIYVRLYKALNGEVIRFRRGKIESSLNEKETSNTYGRMLGHMTILININTNNKDM